jgi:hypothetical protein
MLHQVVLPKTIWEDVGSKIGNSKSYIDWLQQIVYVLGGVLFEYDD